MNAEVWVEVAALGLAAWAAWKTIPRPPARDWERLFKVALATLVRGEVEAAGGDLDAWRERLRALVPYNPALRSPEERLAAPALADVAVPALEGERALVDALASLPDPPARWRRAYEEDERAAALLMDDPALLGPEADPAKVLGPAVDWDAIGDQAPAVRAALARRLGHVVVAGVGIPWTGELGEAAGLRAREVSPETDPAALSAALLTLVEEPSSRLVVVAAGAAAGSVLTALHESPDLRDRVLAVVSIGGELQGPGRDEWMGAHFRHEELDPELARSIPYLAVIDVDPDRPLDRSWAGQRFPSPPAPPSGRRTIDSIDLGPLPVARLPPRLFARALWVVLAFRLLD